VLRRLLGVVASGFAHAPLILGGSAPSLSPDIHATATGLSGKITALYQLHAGSSFTAKFRTFNRATVTFFFTPG